MFLQGCDRRDPSDQLMSDCSSLWQTNGRLHKAQVAVNNGGKDIINLIDSCNKHEKGSLGGFIACSLPLIKEKLLQLFLFLILCFSSSNRLQQ